MISLWVSKTQWYWREGKKGTDRRQSIEIQLTRTWWTWVLKTIFAMWCKVASDLKSHREDMCMRAQSLSLVQLFCSSRDLGLQIPLWNPPGSFVHGCSRQEYWSGLPFPPPGDLPDPGIKPKSLALAGGVFTTESPGKPHREDSLLMALEVYA